MLSLPGPGAGVVRNGLKLRVGRLRAALGGTRLITLLRASLAGIRRRRTLLLRLLVWVSSLTPLHGLIWVVRLCRSTRSISSWRVLLSTRPTVMAVLFRQ